MAEPNSKLHLSDDALELYSLGRLPEDELDAFDEHLLICESCQERLGETDSYVKTMRMALGRMRTEPVPAPKVPWWRQTIWWKPALGFAMAAALVFVVWLPQYRSRGPQVIELSALRGGASSSFKANQPIELRLVDRAASITTDATAEIVNTEGSKVWSGPASYAGDRWNVRIEEGLTAGTYWVRVYSGSDLLREYALVLK